MITKFLVEKANGLIELSPEATDIRYLKFDDGGVEAEVGEFLYSMVRMLKPIYILETGTYTGISTMYMAQALNDNNDGHILTLEIDETHQKRAERLWMACNVGNRTTCKLTSSLDFWPHDNVYDLLFLDSEPEIRFKELVKFYPHLKEGGYIFIHDLPPTFCQGNINPDHPEFKDWPFGTVPQEMLTWLKTDKLRAFSFPSPRGMIGFYKPTSSDYKYL